MQKIRQKQSQAQEQSISLKGSTKIVTEFFEFGLASILYQRGIYPADDFKMVKKYGLNMLMPNEEGLESYLQKITSQLSTWLNAKQVSRLVLAIISKETQETLERWQFDVTLDDDVQFTTTDGTTTDDKENAGKPAKATVSKDKLLSEKDIRNQIQQMIKHICASNAFLPILEQPCTFNVLAYTSASTPVPAAWQDSDARMIKGGNVEQVKLRSFSTNVHKVEALVAYKLGDA